MVRITRLGFIKRVLYKLRQAYGRTVDYYQVTSFTTDYQTGTKTPVRTKTEIKKVIRLPKRRLREMEIMIREFNYGGTFDKDIRFFIIDREMLSSSFIPEVNDYMIEDNIRYNVMEITEVDYKRGYLLKTEAIEGSETREIHTGTLSQTFTSSETMTGVKA